MANTKKAAVGFIFLTLVIDIVGLGIIIPVIPQLIKGLLHTDDLSKELDLYDFLIPVCKADSIIGLDLSLPFKQNTRVQASPAIPLISNPIGYQFVFPIYQLYVFRKVP